MGKVKGLAHIGVKVKDIEVSKKFYTEMLGFTVDNENSFGNTKLAFLSCGTCLLELICSDPEFKGEGTPVVDHICVEVEDIEGLVAELEGKGIVFDGKVGFSAAILGGIKNIFFKGPDAERIEFFEYMR